MLKRINKLKNIGRFSELKSSSGNQGDFAEFNVIYAPNASGKTTLCDVLRSLSTGNSEYVTGRKRFGATAAEIEILLHGQPTPRVSLSDNVWSTDPAGTALPRIMIYDDRFVAENVFVGQHVAVEHRRNLYGIVIGSQGVALKQQVNTAEQELTRATTALNVAKATLTPLIPGGWTTDSFRSLTRVEDVDQRIIDAMQELDAAKRIKQNADAMRQRKPLVIAMPSAVPADLAGVLATTLDQVALRAEAQIRTHLTEHSQGLGLDWVGQGFKAQLGTRCPHCGQDMEGLDILGAYRAFFSGELQKQQEAQQRLLGAVSRNFGFEAQQRLQQILNGHVVERDWWRDAGEYFFELPKGPTVEIVVAAMEAVQAAIVGVIQRKLAQPSAPAPLTEAEQATIDVWLQVSGSLTSYMDALPPINAAIADRQRAARAVDVAAVETRIRNLTAQKRRHEPEVVTAYSNYDAAVANKATKERAKADANENLRNHSKKVIEEYGSRINVLLQRFSADFRIVGAGVSFHGGPPSGDLAVEILGTRISTTPEDARNPSKPSLANTLSSGDRSVLGFAFFLAMVDRDAYLANAVIVFDDPFHSQDRSRRSRTVECIHQVASRSRQCFVLSHDLDFARVAARIVGVPVRTFKMDPMADHSVLEAGDLPPLPGRAYEQDYFKLSAYVRDPAHYATQLKEVARCVRPALEGYLRTKFPEAWAEDDWLGLMIGKLRSAQPGDNLSLAAHLVEDLTELNEYCKRFSHSEVDGSDAANIDARELMNYVNQTLKAISR